MVGDKAEHFTIKPLFFLGSRNFCIAWLLNLYLTGSHSILGCLYKDITNEHKWATLQVPPSPHFFFSPITSPGQWSEIPFNCLYSTAILWLTYATAAPRGACCWDLSNLCPHWCQYGSAGGRQPWEKGSTNGSKPGWASPVLNWLLFDEL